MSEWQPMLSAPKDGTKILLATRKKILGVGDHWTPGAESYLEGARPCWFVNGDMDIAYPTHWMPLPAPPGEA